MVKTTSSHNIRTHLRAYQASDLSAVHEINVQGVPGIGAVSQLHLQDYIARGHCIIAANAAGRPIGFLLSFGPDIDYASKNYLWFTKRYRDFTYIDRIGVAADWRGHSIGQKLYHRLFEQPGMETRLIGCEVNSNPPNPRSLKFHQRLGFKEIGQHTYSPDYSVIYLARGPHL